MSTKRGAAARQDHRATAPDWSIYRIPRSNRDAWQLALIAGLLGGIPWLLLCWLEAVLG